MRKFLTSLGVAIMALSLVAVAAEIPEDITLQGCGEKKPPVPFPHKAHFEYATCVDCHHTSEGLTLETCGDIEVETCVSCHADPAEGVPDCAQMSTKKNPFHLSCIGCHKEAVKEAGDAPCAAPVKCNDCHIKTES